MLEFLKRDAEKKNIKEINYHITNIDFRYH